MRSLTRITLYEHLHFFAVKRYNTLAPDGKVIRVKAYGTARVAIMYRLDR